MKHYKPITFFVILLAILISSCALSESVALPADGYELQLKDTVVTAQDFSSPDFSLLSATASNKIVAPSTENHSLVEEANSFLSGVLGVDKNSRIFFTVNHWVYKYQVNAPQNVASFTRDFDEYKSVQTNSFDIENYYSKCGFINADQSQFQDCVFVAMYEDRVSVFSIHLDDVIDNNTFIGVFGGILERVYIRVKDSVQ